MSRRRGSSSMSGTLAVTTSTGGLAVGAGGSAGDRPAARRVLPRLAAPCVAGFSPTHEAGRGDGRPALLGGGGSIDGYAEDPLAKPCFDFFARIGVGKARMK